MTQFRTLFVVGVTAAVASFAFGGASTEASAGARVLSGNVVTTRPINKNAPTLRNAQGHRITGRSLGKTPGQQLCQKMPAGGYTCARVS
jgi:hypothetical protein